MNMETAYDGFSKRRQRRALKPLERDVLTRILDDIIHELRHSQSTDSLMFVCSNHGIRLEPQEIPMLVGIRNAIDPRNE